MKPASTLERRPLLEAAVVLAVTLPLGLWMSAFWLLIPLTLLVLTNRRLDEYGLSWRAGPVGLHVVVSIAIFGGYAVVHAAFAVLVQHASFEPRLPVGLAALAVHQLANVALPEEFFFRGYLQTRLNHVWGQPFRTFGARWGWGLPVSSAVFALCHLFYGDPTQLKVFFFGVFAGWLRERTGGILTPVVYHAVANLLLQILLESFRSA